MTDKTFTMTMAQMKAMFDAGRHAGESAYGSRYYDVDEDFVEAVHEMVNENVKWGEPTHVNWAEVKAMVKEG